MKIESDSVNLLFCPLCGGTEFIEFGWSDDQPTAIYCKNCPYGVEDGTKNIKELREIHNRRSTRKN